MTNNEDVNRINRNIEKLEKRIEQLRANNGENGRAIAALSREKFNQQKILHMLAAEGEMVNRPVNINEALQRAFEKLGIASTFN